MKVLKVIGLAASVSLLSGCWLALVGGAVAGGGGVYCYEKGCPIEAHSTPTPISQPIDDNHIPSDPQ